MYFVHECICVLKFPFSFLPLIRPSFLSSEPLPLPAPPPPPSLSQTRHSIGAFLDKVVDSNAMIDGPVQGGTLPRPPSRSKATKVSSISLSLSFSLTLSLSHQGLILCDYVLVIGQDCICKRIIYPLLPSLLSLFLSFSTVYS